MDSSPIDLNCSFIPKQYLQKDGENSCYFSEQKYFLTCFIRKACLPQSQTQKLFSLIWEACRQKRWEVRSERDPKEIIPYKNKPYRRNLKETPKATSTQLPPTPLSLFYGKPAD